MENKYRALHVVALFYKVIAWIVLVVGGLLAVFSVILGAIQERVGFQSPLVARMPVFSQASGLLSGLLAGAMILIVSLIQFIFVYAVSELIHLGLAIEHNTRETAFYLRGENSLPAPPPPVSWDTPVEFPDEES